MSCLIESNLLKTMTKWNEPPEPIPSWLDPTCEITSLNDNKPTSWDGMKKTALRAVFILACFKALRVLGLNHKQSLEVLGNSIVETGWGTSFRAWNLGGWKIREADVKALKAQGKKALWWRAPGNKSSGDPPWCYYKGFASLEEFFAAWLIKFVPKPGTVQVDNRYYKTGTAFWSDKDWFKELCLSGYKGAVTASNPQGSITGHQQILKLSMTILCQQGLGLEFDGAWGDKSTEACKLYQKTHGLLEAGQPSLALLQSLYP